MDRPRADDVLSVDDVRRVRDLFARPGAVEVPFRIVSPSTYAIRSECPLWTSRGKPDHVHTPECVLDG